MIERPQPVPPTPLQRLLAEQQDMTAVERFSLHHDAAGDNDSHAGTYRDLIPLAAPQAGQQYAFEVDLDLCTGCKACVTGCHNLNGLDDGEIWRTVGLLHGGTAARPAQQTVTTACHHCLEPACLEGCPVKAYEKHPVTGIVKHLDDQCIGCQYCVFMCPYDAPKFNAALGIVRKCDMCSDRLANDEAPACVQSCPNQAIRIAVVDRVDAIEASCANVFLPGAPGPADTVPTTVYKTARALPHNMLPADFYTVSPEHAHLPLVVMLTLTQLSVGAFVLNLATHRLMGSAAGRALTIGNAVFALFFGLAAMAASTLHLGRPIYGFRAFLGLRTSWLSREIIGFSLFAGLAATYAAAFAVPAVRLSPVARAWHGALGTATAAVGIASVACSVMVYAATRRAHWRASLTGLKFFATTVILGAATVLMVSTILTPGGAGRFVDSGIFGLLCKLLIATASIKLGAELAVLRHLRDEQHSTGKRAAILLTRDLAVPARLRFACGLAGGVVLPAAALVTTWLAVLISLSLGIFLLSLAGELLERSFFFSTAPASKMPGGLE
ncbi:MAG TPA: DmsC/YnfH family molybdoenzyme membrane anchor subunit [Polyangia bacterium]|jgi:Fe-S-cluster-containing dehydrogenase component/DMSO reductase anchor subunit|nr:DmsC/YnfH family molybdoenzyme membrane anchor subunit [Polyangia bacterium]